MGRNKKYSGYKPFQYLEPNVDYQHFKMPKEIDRVEPYLVPLSKVEEERTEELIEKNIFISMHDHPFCWPPEDPSESYDYRRQCRIFTAYEGLAQSGMDAVFDFMLDGALATSKSGWKWEDVIYDLGMRLTDMAHQDFAVHCKRVDDIVYAFKTGKIAHIFCTKAPCIENEVDRIDILHGLGVRCLGVTYSESNMLGLGLNDNDLMGGLTDFGYDCVKRMNKIGMLIDIGHCADQTCLDIIEASDKPVIASHNVPRAIARGHTSPDDVLVALAEKGGVIGINGGGGGGRSLSTKNNPAGGIEGNMECIEYCIDLMGIDYVGFGIDSMYGDHRKAVGRRLPRGHYNRPSKNKEAPWKSPLAAPRFSGWDDPAIDPGYAKGLENPSDNLNQIRWLVGHGYTDEDIIKIMGGNALQLLRAVWY